MGQIIDYRAIAIIWSNMIICYTPLMVSFVVLMWFALLYLIWFKPLRPLVALLREQCSTCLCNNCSNYDIIIIHALVRTIRIINVFSTLAINIVDGLFIANHIMIVIHDENQHDNVNICLNIVVHICCVIIVIFRTILKIIAIASLNDVCGWRCITGGVVFAIIVNVLKHSSQFVC